MIEGIGDPSDPRVAEYRDLRDSRGRRRLEEAGGFFIAEGETVVHRLLESAHPTRSVLVTPHRRRRMATALDALTAPVYVVEPAVLAAIAGFDAHRGVLASGTRLPSVGLDELTGSVAVLEGINDHENLGALFRSAAALGVGGVVLDPTCADPYYRRSVRVSMGAVLTVPIARAVRWPADLAVVGRGRTTVATTLSERAVPIDELRVDGPVAVVVGAEGPGLRPDTVAHCDVETTIPLRGAVDSLNVGHAAAIAFHRLVAR